MWSKLLSSHSYTTYIPSKQKHKKKINYINSIKTKRDIYNLLMHGSHQNQTWYIQPPNGSHQNPRVASQTAYNNHYQHKRHNLLLELKSIRSFSYPLAQLVKKVMKDIHQTTIQYLTYLILNKRRIIWEVKPISPLHRHILSNVNIQPTYNKVGNISYPITRALLDMVWPTSSLSRQQDIDVYLYSTNFQY